MPNAFQTVALIGKYKSPEIAPPLLRLAGFLRKRGITVLLDPLTAAHVGTGDHPAVDLQEVGRSAELAIVIGGDGTMLNIARTLAPFDVALVGINQGRLGFLTDLAMNGMLDSIGAILDGEYATESRMLLQAEVVSGGRQVLDVIAFNDVSVNKGAEGSLIEIEVRIDGRFVYNLRSDGLIVATPTGSTAYALSSGGPILHPSLDVIGLVPVCPHTLSNRPIVVNRDSVIEVLILKAADARAHFDSHSHQELVEGDRVVVRRCPHAIRLLHPSGYDYYHMLREKLHWSESP
ncbi:MAG TPA: NAD kinase [Burkholderiales bacterium]|jgi:NAD+ kinase|nr:NAD kinase [Burkholderiales bacterium]